MQYKIIRSNDDDALSEMVTEAINKGWIPYGGVQIAIATTASDDIVYEYAQAVTTHENV